MKSDKPAVKVEDNLLWQLLRAAAREDEAPALDAVLAQTRRIWLDRPLPAAAGGDDGFLWATAIEATNIAQLSVDQMAWSQHNILWKQDLARIRYELNLRHVRLAPPWHRIHTAPDRFDWRWLDEYLDFAVGELGLIPILDVCHFGTPLWIREQFGDPEFPAAMEDWAAALAARYGGRIKYWCPVNEPYITALFAGDFGFWPPYWRHQEGFVRMIANITRGQVLAHRAIKDLRPDAVIVHVDTVERATTDDERLFEDMEIRNLRRFVVTDLMSGRIGPRHPLTGWLSKRGLTEADMDWFARRAVLPDILGLDYYPQAEVRLFMRPGPDGIDVAGQEDPLQAGAIDKLFDADHRSRVPEVWPTGLYQIAREYYDRYRIPLMITETNWAGPVEHRLRWLEYCVGEVRRLRAAGFPMMGFTWYGAYDHLDWGYALRLPSGHIHHVGLWELDRRDGILARRHTAMVDRYRQMVAAGAQGPLATAAFRGPAGTGAVGTGTGTVTGSP